MDFTSRFTIGSRQMTATTTQIRTKIQSPAFADFDLIIVHTSYQIPRSPSRLEIQFASNRKITQITDWNNPTAVVSEN